MSRATQVATFSISHSMSLQLQGWRLGGIEGGEEGGADSISKHWLVVVAAVRGLVTANNRFITDKPGCCCVRSDGVATVL